MIIIASNCDFRVPVESDGSDNEKPKSKAKNKKSVDEDIKEVTKNVKNVSVSNKSQKKSVQSSDGKDLLLVYLYLQCYILKPKPLN